MIYKRIDVALDKNSYPIFTGLSMIASFAPTCREFGIPDNVVIITDKNVARYHLNPLIRNLTHFKFNPLIIEIPAGESQKSLRRANLIYTEMLAKKVTRNSAIIAFGGGVIGDLAGFVAATYQRGIKIIQVPTTLLAQVDSSIGGKVGVNHPLGKNMIGAFYQPVFVWMDVEYLKTLSFRELICGIGEIVKYGIISDRELFEFLETNFERILQLDFDAVKYVQSQCASIKADVVSKDEKESNIRVILNCGHTIGHGLESAGKYKLLKHGEAVLLGLIAESFIAKSINLLNDESYNRIVSLINRIPIKAKLGGLKVSDVFNAIGRDKKRISKKNRFVLPKEIGQVEVVEEIDDKLIKRAIKEVIKLKED